MFPIEIWKPVKGFADRYEVSSLGRLRGVSTTILRSDGILWRHKGKILQPSVNRRGYLRIGMGRNGNFKTKEIHRLIAKAFVPNPHRKPCTNHKNGCKTDNRPENMEWVTHQENCQHAQDMGLNRARFSLKQREAVRKTGLANRGRIPWNKR